MNMGKSSAKFIVIGNSRRFGSPTALNQTAGPVVSKRIKLNAGLALYWRNGPVSSSPRGRIIWAVQSRNSLSHPLLANGDD